MSINQNTASHVVPLLARLVLAAAFIPAGWNKLTGTAHFSPEQVTTLRELGVTVRDDGATTHAGTNIAFVARRAASWSAESRVTDETDIQRGAREAVAPPRPVAAPTDESGPPADPVAPPIELPIELPVPSGQDRPAPVLVDAPPLLAPGGTAGALHTVTLMVHGQGWPAPVLQAWMATGVELLGGALILIGLFSRVWGLGLATTMGVAFWLTSWPVLQDTSLFALSHDAFNRLFAQAGLFVLAFGIVLTGPGAVSIDRILFPRTGAEEPTPA